MILSLVTAARWKAARRPATTWCSRVDVDGDRQRDAGPAARGGASEPTNPNEPKTLSADNLVTLTATITDKDGDSATAT